MRSFILAVFQARYLRQRIFDEGIYLLRRDLAIGGFVFEFDDIGAGYGSDEIMQVFFRVLDGYDVVSVVPDRKACLSSRLFYGIFERFTVLSYWMQTERFRILSRRVINWFTGMNRAFPYRRAVYANWGLATERIAYHVWADSRRPDRREKSYRRRLAVSALIMFTNVGYRFSILMTPLMMFVAAFMLIYSLVVYLISTPVPGRMTFPLPVCRVFRLLRDTDGDHQIPAAIAGADL